MEVLEGSTLRRIMANKRINNLLMKEHFIKSFPE